MLFDIFTIFYTFLSLKYDKVLHAHSLDILFQIFNLQFISQKFITLISYKTLPGGGTTDYAVEIYHEALKNQSYTCFLKEDTSLPMLYMPDAIKATINITEAPIEQIKVRSSYNLAGFSFDPAEISESIKKHIPEFEISYEPDFRQQIADGWPASIDDSVARNDWGWKNDFGMDEMTQDMLKNLKGTV